MFWNGTWPFLLTQKSCWSTSGSMEQGRGSVLNAGPWTLNPRAQKVNLSWCVDFYWDLFVPWTFLSLWRKIYGSMAMNYNFFTHLGYGIEELFIMTFGFWYNTFIWYINYEDKVEDDDLKQMLVNHSEGGGHSLFKGDALSLRRTLKMTNSWFHGLYIYIKNFFFIFIYLFTNQGPSGGIILNGQVWKWNR